VPCSASRVVPGAHRVVGPGTHRGSGPREVHTTIPSAAVTRAAVPVAPSHAARVPDRERAQGGRGRSPERGDRSPERGPGERGQSPKRGLGERERDPPQLFPNHELPRRNHRAAAPNRKATALHLAAPRRSVRRAGSRRREGEEAEIGSFAGRSRPPGKGRSSCLEEGASFSLSRLTRRWRFRLALGKREEGMEQAASGGIHRGTCVISRGCYFPI
jgi:hypothetical protein